MRATLILYALGESAASLAALLGFNENRVRDVIKTGVAQLCGPCDSSPPR
jgi:hypothetical protein